MTDSQSSPNAPDVKARAIGLTGAANGTPLEVHVPRVGPVTRVDRGRPIVLI